MPNISFSSTRTFDRRVITWAAAATGDTFAPFVMDVPGSVAAVQIDGTFGGATATLQGSVDGTTYFTLNNVAGDPVSATSAALFELSTAVLYVRPALAAGTGNALNFRLVVRTQDSIC